MKIYCGDVIGVDNNDNNHGTQSIDIGSLVMVIAICKRLQLVIFQKESRAPKRAIETGTIEIVKIPKKIEDFTFLAWIHWPMKYKKRQVSRVESTSRDQIVVFVLYIQRNSHQNLTISFIDWVMKTYCNNALLEISSWMKRVMSFLII